MKYHIPFKTTIHYDLKPGPNQRKNAKRLTNLNVRDFLQSNCSLKTVKVMKDQNNLRNCSK